MVLWLLRRDVAARSLATAVKRLAPGIQQLQDAPTDVLADFAKAERVKWQPIIRAAGINRPLKNPPQPPVWGATI